MNESPVLLKMNPLLQQSDKLPLTLYESVIDIVDGDAVLLFVELPYTLATEVGDADFYYLLCVKIRQASPTYGLLTHQC